MAMFAGRLAQRPAQRFAQSQAGKALEMFNTVSDARDAQTNGNHIAHGRVGEALANMGSSALYGAALGPFGTLGQMGVNSGLFGGSNQNQ